MLTNYKNKLRVFAVVVVILLSVLACNINGNTRVYVANKYIIPPAFYYLTICKVTLETDNAVTTVCRDQRVLKARYDIYEIGDPYP